MEVSGGLQDLVRGMNQLGQDQAIAMRQLQTSSEDLMRRVQESYESLSNALAYHVDDQTSELKHEESATRDRVTSKASELQDDLGRIEERMKLQMTMVTGEQKRLRIAVEGIQDTLSKIVTDTELQTAYTYAGADDPADFLRDQVDLLRMDLRAWTCERGRVLDIVEHGGGVLGLLCVLVWGLLRCRRPRPLLRLRHAVR